MRYSKINSCLNRIQKNGKSLAILSFDTPITKTKKIDNQPTPKSIPVLCSQCQSLAGIKEKTLLVRMGLETLISKESSRRLAQLGGSEGQLKYIKKRKFAK